MRISEASGQKLGKCGVAYCKHLCPSGGGLDCTQLVGQIRPLRVCVLLTAQSVQKCKYSV